MSVELRLGAIAAALLVPLLALAQWHVAVGRTGSGVTAPALADRIGPRVVVRSQPLPAVEVEVLQPDVYVSRIYAADSVRPILLYAGLYAGRATYGKGAHDPAICYPSAGWEILDTRSVRVPLANGEEFVATRLRAQRGNARQDVLYWFQPAGRWPRSEGAEQVLRIVDAIAGRPQYAFVRLAAPASDDAASARSLIDFAANVGPAVRAALETSHR
jgi:EpsI family protein